MTLENAQELKQDVLFRAGEKTDGTSDFDEAAMDYLNRVYRSLWTGGGEFEPGSNTDWWWLLTSGTLMLETALKDVEASVTQDSDSVTLDEAPGKDLTGYHFRVKDHEDVFVVDSHDSPPSGTSLTLDEDYTGDTDSEATVTIFKIDYDLASDMLRLADPLQINKASENKAWAIARDRFHDLYPLNRIQKGVPSRYTVTGEQSIRFNGFVEDEKARVDYWYLQEPSDLTDDTSSIPLVPKHYRKVLADMALMFVLSDKNDTRASDAGQMARSGIRAMQRENDIRWGRQMRGQVIRPRMPQGIRAPRLRTDEEGLLIP